MFGWFSRLGKKSAIRSLPAAAMPAASARPENTAREPSQKFEHALAEHQAGRLANAEAAYREVLAENPGHVDALHFLGVIAYQLGKHTQAVEWITQALTQYERNVPAHTNLGKAYQAHGEPDRAIACYRRALELEPDYFDAHLHLAHAHAFRGETREALAWYRSALSRAPEDPAVRCALGNAFDDLGEPEQAVACFRSAIALKPDFAEAHCDLGTALKALNRLDEATDSYREALRLKPEHVIAHFNLGIVLRDRHRPDEAIACFTRAIELKPDFADAYYCLGHTYCDGDRVAEARRCFQTALSLRPDFAEARWSLAMSRLPSVYGAGDDPLALRTAFAADLEALEQWFESNPAAPGHQAVGVQQPFALAYQEQNNRDLLQRYGRLCTRLMGQWFDRQSLPRHTGPREAGPIRVGIVSQYFRNHSVWTAIVRGWFDQIDRERFAIQAFCLGVEEDAETVFARSRAAHFERGPKQLRQWMETIARQRPDVLIYPEIGMDPMTLRLASVRLASVQIATWGHPETTGLPTIDHYLSAQSLEPENAQAHYTERLVALPGLGCYVEPAQVDPVFPDLSQWGIDPDAPIFICPGTPFKYAPQHDLIFPQIARRLGNCRFVFFKHWTPGLSERLEQRLRAAFDRAGLDCGSYVTFIPWQSRPAFYGLMQRADVFLDTIGFSGFNTALQALDCGLPIVTLEGRFLRGRLASGILRHMGAHQLVTSSVEDYVALAVRLIEDAGFDEAVRARIESGRDALYKDSVSIRALENFLLEVTTHGRA